LELGEEVGRDAERFGEFDDPKGIVHKPPGW